MTSDNIKSVLILGAAGVAAFMVYRAVKGATGVVESITQGAQQLGANVAQAWNNATSAPASGGDPVKAALYSDRGYAGTDETGASVLDGEWFGTEEGRRYSYQYREAAAAQGKPAPVESSNGAAFGIYPSAQRRQQASQAPAPAVNEAITDRWDYYTTGGRGAASGSGSVDERATFEQLSNPDYQPQYNFWSYQ